MGAVTQTFLDELNFINAVRFGDVLKISLYAERQIMDDDRIKVTFKRTGVSVLGGRFGPWRELFRKEISGSGVWKQRYVSEDASIRVMDTVSWGESGHPEALGAAPHHHHLPNSQPSLFILKKRGCGSG